MENLKYAAIFITIFSISACNQNNPPSGNDMSPDAPPAQENPSNSILAEGSSPYEDLIEFAIEQDNEGIKTSIDQINEELPQMTSLMPPNNQESLKNYVQNMIAAIEAGEYDQISLNSVEAYKVIVSSLDTSDIIVPLEVSYLDYVGFKLSILAEQEPLDWAAMKLAVEEAEQNWEIIRGVVEENKGLFNTMNIVIEGMEKAVEMQNIEMTRFAAEVELEVVDLLENFYEDHSTDQ